MDIPSHLSKALFEESLSKTLKKNVNIQKFDIKRNTAGGNYCSYIYRVTVEFLVEGETKPQTLKLLVKDLFESVSANSREYFMYSTVLPELNALLQKHCGADLRISPTLYAAHKATGELHIFDDLNEQGYEICDRLLGFNEEETKMVLKKLAQQHATSMIYKEKNPEVVDTMKDFFVKSDPNLMAFVDHVISDNTAYAAKIVEKWPNYQEIANKMRKNVGEQFRTKFLSILNKEDAKIRVIIHGDLWIKNILMRKNVLDVEDAIFVDYQNSCDGSPGLDINNLLMTSVQLDVLRTKRMELIKHYYQSLCDTLRACDYTADKIPTLDMLLSEIQRTEYLTYYDLIFAFPQTNLSEELAQGMDITGFFDPVRVERNLKDMFSNRRVLDTYAYVLRRLDELGVLD